MPGLRPRRWIRNRLGFLLRWRGCTLRPRHWFRNRFGFLFHGRGCTWLRSWAPRARGRRVVGGVGWDTVVQPTRVAQPAFWNHAAQRDRNHDRCARGAPGYGGPSRAGAAAGGRLEQRWRARW